MTSAATFRAPLRRLRPSLATTSARIEFHRPTHFALRHHSHSSTPISYLPHGRTSADTQIPYGDATLPSAPLLPSPTPDKATPIPELPKNMTARQKKLIQSIIRVDQAGELGANYIYRGQMAGVRMGGGDEKTAGLVQEMWDGEKKHIAALDKLVTTYGVRPTALYPLWKAMGWGLGAGTALLGPRAAMACTEAVETVIGEHYDAQLAELDEHFPGGQEEGIEWMKKVIKEFRDDELGHLDTAVENEAQLAPAHALLSAIVAVGCRAAIAVSEKV